jgi:hypothetical protein
LTAKGANATKTLIVEWSFEDVIPHWVLQVPHDGYPEAGSPESASFDI